MSAAPDMSMLAGTILFGKYQLESLLGSGGMGSVWRAQHLGFKAPVAVKLMDPAVAQTIEGLARFHREAHAAAVIRSPHVVQVLDHGLDEETQTPFIVMELLEGETLGKRLQREGRLSLATTSSIVADVCRALMRAHQAGIVHRDLKPDNIFLVHDEREVAKVLDFGVAKAHALAVGFGDNTRTGDLIGTPCYMSPEQIRGVREVDGRSDLWSLAVIACQCITGKRPFDAPTLGGLAIAICTEPIPSARSLGPATPEFEAWLERALGRDPEQRFQTAREFSEALAALLGEAQRVVTTPTLAQPTQGAALDDAPLANTLAAQTTRVAPQRRLAQLGVAGVLLLALSGTGLWLSSRWLTRKQPAPDDTTAADAPATADRSAAPSQPLEAAAPLPPVSEAGASPSPEVSQTPAVEVPAPPAPPVPTPAASASPRTTRSANPPAKSERSEATGGRDTSTSRSEPPPSASHAEPVKPPEPQAPSGPKAHPKLKAALAGER